MLLVLAFITCMRQRNRGRESDLPVHSYLLNHQLRIMRHLGASREEISPSSTSLADVGESRVPPPAYMTVIREKEEEEKELPSYSSAIKRKERDDIVNSLETEEVKVKDVESVTQESEGDEAIVGIYNDSAVESDFEVIGKSNQL